MIIFSLTVFFSVIHFCEPFCFFAWFLVVDLYLVVWGFFCLPFLLSHFFYWGSLGYSLGVI